MILGDLSEHGAWEVRVDEEPILELRSSRPRPDVAVIEVEGELDGSNVARLREELEAVGDTAHIAIDLGGIGFVDSSGIEVLVRAQKQAPGSIHLLGVARSRAVTRVLDLFGLSGEFDQHPDVDALLHALGPA
jgi:stage II sporulation protein AA (anti-sigma F factor antagonist)